MIPQKTLRDLEWSHVQRRLAELALSEPGGEYCSQILPEAGFFDAGVMLDETAQAKGIIDSGEDIPTGELEDPTPIIERLRVQAPLNAAELSRLRIFLEISRRTRNMIQRNRNAAPVLWNVARDLVALRDAERRIESCFTPTGEVADGASPELGRLRTEERQLHTAIVNKLNGILASSKYKELLQEDFFTIRNGRYVVPIKVEHRGEFPGIVHDMSGSGQSIFVEPPQITDLNNRLRTAQLDIEREIRRIFYELSRSFFDVTGELERSYQILLDLELIFARARYAIKLGASKPKLDKAGHIELKRLVHPVLVEQLDSVIPNDVELGRGFYSLVITGPNMGGKTVLMKAIGLSALFVKAGLFVCADEGSQIAVFEDVFTDIGDDQSVERGLSSFAARLLNLKSIVDQATESSLVLLDEIGEGTEPRQGAALACAVMSRLSAKRARTIVTTHFSELVALAIQSDGMENGAMEFDTERLEPTFRFVLGVPGSSSPLEIARQLGVDRELIEDARRFLGEREAGLDEIMKHLEDLRRSYHQELGRAKERSQEAERTLSEQKEVLAKLKRKERLALNKLVRELEGEVRDVRELLREARRLAQTPSPSKFTVKSAADKLEQAESRVSDKRDEVIALDAEGLDPVRDASDLKEGTRVFVAALKEEGIVQREPDERGRVVVAIRGKNYQLDAQRLYWPSKDVADKGEDVVRLGPPEFAGRSRKLNLRGLTREEAALEVERALDRAMREGVAEITFIHGHGTGVLKEEVRKRVSESPYVKSYRAGGPHEGGDGVTVVELDL